MTPSYRQLIAEHEAIVASAETLLARVGDSAAPPELAALLDALARQVHDHILAEEVVVARIDRTGVAEMWRQVWVNGRAAFEVLRTDWLSFIARWTAAAIACDPDGFRAEATAMLGRLGARLRLESGAWYAVALHGGALSVH